MAIDGYCQYNFGMDVPSPSGMPTTGTEVT
jgi:hypothetical protein